MKTFSQKPADVVRKWYLLDASELPLGRVATAAASLLIGKAKPTVTAHVDGGDYVVIVNADKLVVTGTKMTDKMYYRHSQYPGNLKSATLQEKLVKNPVAVLQHAISGMLPKNKLQAARLQRLKIYAGAEHQHTAQQPSEYKLKEVR